MFTLSQEVLLGGRKVHNRRRFSVTDASANDCIELVVQVFREDCHSSTDQSYHGVMGTSQVPDGVMVAADEVLAEQVAGWLAGGALVIVPTETVYGLAIKPGNASSTQRVFELKARPRDFNLPVVIGAIDQLADLGVDYNDTARRLAQRFWPGPLTLVMGFRPGAPRSAWLADRIEVAIRFPGMKLLRDVALSAGPFLLTSANAHGTGAKQVAREALESLHGIVDYVIDGGTLSPMPSTIINVRHSPAVIERVGVLTELDLKEFIEAGDVLPERKS